MDNFTTLDDIFEDDIFKEMFASLRPAKVEQIDPEVEKFQELLEWVRENGREPSPVGSLAEKLKYRYLKGLRMDENRHRICLPYDDLNFLGEYCE